MTSEALRRRLGSGVLLGLGICAMLVVALWIWGRFIAAPRPAEAGPEIFPATAFAPALGRATSGAEAAPAEPSRSLLAQLRIPGRQVTVAAFARASQPALEAPATQKAPGTPAPSEPAPDRPKPPPLERVEEDLWQPQP